MDSGSDGSGFKPKNRHEILILVDYFLEHFAKTKYIQTNYCIHDHLLISNWTKKQYSIENLLLIISHLIFFSIVSVLY